MFIVSLCMRGGWVIVVFVEMGGLQVVKCREGIMFCARRLSSSESVSIICDRSFEGL